LDKPICVIPARAGSKRIPGKNTRLLGGKPLVQWIIEAAVEADIFEQIYVTTDSNEVRTIAKGLGVRTHQRPTWLTGDDVRAEEVFADFVRYYKNAPEIACMAMPTAPFTRPESLRGAYEYMTDTGVPGIFLGVATEFNTYRTVALEPYGDIHPVSGSWETMGLQSQDLNPTYRPTYGGMFIKTEHLLETTSYYATKGQDMWVVQHPEGIDIDTEDDWQQAERYLSERFQKEPV
jgi:CMP-N-acetylneuraminic acid synthetase